MIKILKHKKCKISQELIRGFTLDLPPAKGLEAGKPFGIMGWIVGGRFVPIRIEARLNNGLSYYAPMRLQRPDVARLYHGVSPDENLGFFCYINPLVLSPVFQIKVVAINARGHELTLYVLEGRRDRPHIAWQVKPALIAVTTLGRTGSTATLALLGSHPQVVVYRPYQVEARYASYWCEIILSLGNPASWICPIAADTRTHASWVFGHELSKPHHYALYDELIHWFQDEYLVSLYDFVGRSFQAHYAKVASVQGKAGARYCCEKFLPEPFTKVALDLYPGSKEILLVRDFRDMFCSINAFNRKRGFLGFGREKFGSNEEYLEKGLVPSVENLVRYWEERKDSAFLLRYEDLVLDTHEWLRRLLDFLGLDSSDRLIKRILKTAQRTDPQSQDRHRTSRAPQESIGRFRRELPPAQLDMCNQLLARALEKFGYTVA